MNEPTVVTTLRKPIKLADIATQAERASSVLAQARDEVLAPQSTKAPPTFTASQLIDKLKIDRSQYDYRMRNPAGLPVGRLSKSGARREFTLAELRQWAKHYMPQNVRPEGAEAICIVVTHFKGGSSKTTTAATLAQGLSSHSLRVLLVDVDPQSSLTTLMGLLPDTQVGYGDTLTNLFSGQEPDVRYCIRKTYWDGIDLIPAASTLSSSEFFLPTRQLKEPAFDFWTALDYGLDPIRSEYDVIILDTPPSLSYMTVNALMAADGILMPLPPSSLDFASSTQFWAMFTDLTKTFEARGLSKEYAFINVLLSKVKYAAPRENAGQSTSIIREWIRAAYADRVMPVEIPDVEAVRTASKDFGTVYDATPDLAATRTFKSALAAYDRLVELIEQEIVDFWRGQIGG